MTAVFAESLNTDAELWFLPLSRSRVMLKSSPVIDFIQAPWLSRCSMSRTLLKRREFKRVPGNPIQQHFHLAGDECVSAMFLNMNGTVYQFIIFLKGYRIQYLPSQCIRLYLLIGKRRDSASWGNSNLYVWVMLRITVQRNLLSLG